MKACEIRLAEEGSDIRNRLTHILSGLSRKFCEYAGPIHSIDSKADSLDVATAYRDREMRLRLLERERDLIKDTLEALHRIETGRYGICRNCGEEIGLGRLEASPTTTLCIECKQEQEHRAGKKAPSFRTLSSAAA